ncbi:preprotein translocase subunit YajC [Novosphingobium colocasiae]|uniref:preprotein translocase subunit YajC n=1 Tax=Novosphingobium colocasiae TaxID=1256513 RepID=UPI0035B383F2
MSAQRTSASLKPASSLLVIAALGIGGIMPQTALAQSIGYDTVGSSGSSGEDQPVYAPDDKASKRAGKSGRGGKGGKQVYIAPYLELDQIVDAQLSPGNDVLTYTQAAVGVDLGISGRNNAASASVRYERHFGWGKNARDGDVISGIARGYATVIPGFTIEAGALATQANVENGGAAVRSGLVDDESTTNIYSIYGGPSLTTRAGDVNLSANYRAGFTKVENDNAFRASPTGAAADVFDKSTVQVADAEAGVAPGTVLPVGLAVAGSFYQEDVSNLDQRVRDMQGRGMVTVPVSRTVQVTGAIGYEDVEVSSRDARRDEDGDPIIGSDGRYVTDKSSPRVLAYDVSGMTWEVGVMWRPSPRTALSAYVGKRYGSTSYGGTFSYAPNDRSALSVAVYDNIAGFGGQVNRVLDKLPDDFEVVRDPLTGNITSCVNTLDGNGCFGGALGSVRSSTFRARGVAANYTMRIGQLNAGIGAGYDRRKFIAASGTVLAAANGVLDENYWLAAYLSGALGDSAGWSTNAYANWLTTSDPLAGDVTGYGATASYYRMLTRRLRATAAVGIDGISRKDAAIDDIWTASALLGLRYGF